MLPNDQEIGVALDAQAIEALRAIAPGVVSVRISLDPAPALTDPTMEGALGGGIVRPHARPVRIRIEALDRAGDVMRLPGPQAISGETTSGAGSGGPEGVLGVLSAWESLEVNLSLPVMTQPAEPGRVFAWLHGAYVRGRFVGYRRPDARFDALSGSLRLRLPLGDLQSSPEGTLFLPAVLQPSWVQSFVPDLHIYSGPTDGAVDYGPAGPQLTIYTVVGPQVGSRIYVFNPATLNYGWIDASGVGPSGPPPSQGG